MLTLKSILAATRQMGLYGEHRGGSCFGVTDPSHLRPPSPSGTPETIPSEDVFRLRVTRNDAAEKYEVTRIDPKDIPPGEKIEKS
jgi:hypothetical protein